MTIAKIQYEAIGPRIWAPEGPYGAASLSPFPGFEVGTVVAGDREGEFVFLKLGVTGALTMNQGDCLVWDNNFMAQQSATGAGASPIGAGVGTFWLGGRIVPELPAGGPYPLPVWQYVFPTPGIYGIWAQRAGVGLINCASVSAGKPLNTTAVAGQLNAPATALVGSMGIANIMPAPQSWTFTGTTTIGSNVLTAVSTNVGLAIGQSLSGTGVAAGAYITDIQGSTVTMSAAATAAGSVTITAKNNATIGNTTTGSPLVTGVPNLPGIYPNATIAGTGIPASTTILGISGQPGNYTLTLSQNATATGTAVALTTSVYIEGMLRWGYIGVQN
jgi:hypothetical protein